MRQNTNIVRLLVLYSDLCVFVRYESLLKTTKIGEQKKKSDSHTESYPIIFQSSPYASTDEAVRGYRSLLVGDSCVTAGTSTTHRSLITFLYLVSVVFHIIVIVLVIIHTSITITLRITCDEGDYQFFVCLVNVCVCVPVAANAAIKRNTMKYIIRIRIVKIPNCLYNSMLVVNQCRH